MEQLTKSRLFRYGIWTLLGLVILYFIWPLRPLFLHLYEFLKTIIAPFAVAMIISYVLNPVVSMLGGRKVPRSVAVSSHLCCVFSQSRCDSDEPDSDVH